MNVKNQNKDNNNAKERSFELTTIFAGVAYAAFKKTSDKEAEITYSNCNTKINLKTDD